MFNLKIAKAARIKPLVAAILAAGLVSSVAHAEYQLADGLTMTGFVDMSYNYMDPDGDASSTSESGLDQFEINLMYDFGDGLTSVVDLEYQDNGAVDGAGDAKGEEAHVEQAYIKYALNDAWSVKAGRFLSYSGWETEDPTGLYQYSGTGYAKYFYGAYQQGASVYYGSDSFDAAVSIVNDLGTLTGDTRDAKNPAVEMMAAFHPGDAWTLKGFYMIDKSDANSEDITMINIWSSYVVGGWTLAAEVNTSENTGAANALGGDESDAEGYLLMVNYGWEKWGLTFRYNESEVESKAGVTVEDISAFTLAPSYKLTENLLLVAEYRMDEKDVGGDDSDSFALEALLTF